MIQIVFHVCQCRQIYPRVDFIPSQHHTRKPSSSSSWRLSHKIFNLENISQPTKFFRMKRRVESFCFFRSPLTGWRCHVEDEKIWKKNEQQLYAMLSIYPYPSHTRLIQFIASEVDEKYRKSSKYIFFTSSRPRFMGKTECVTEQRVRKTWANSSSKLRRRKNDVDDNNEDEMLMMKKTTTCQWIVQSTEKGIGLKVFPHIINIASSIYLERPCFLLDSVFFNKENAMSERNWSSEEKESQRGKSFIHNWHHDRRVENILEKSSARFGRQCQRQCRRIQST